MTPSPGLAVGTPLPDTGGHAHVRLEKLDHLRFVACLMVMIWHFSHAFVPATGVPSWTWLSLIEEGHTGVSLFCVISGFIFGWLYYGRSIVLRQFARNRALRILPIFLLWLALAYVTSTWEPAAFMVIVFTTLARYQLPSYASRTALFGDARLGRAPARPLAELHSCGKGQTPRTGDGADPPPASDRVSDGDSS